MAPSTAAQPAISVRWLDPNLPSRERSESRFFGLLAPSGEFQFDYAKMHNGQRSFAFKICWG
jgi:hypothetical protein